MSYRLVQALEKEAVTVIQFCRLLGFSRSGFYDTCMRELATPNVRASSVKVQAALARSGRTFSRSRLRTALAHDGIAIGRYRICNLMNKHHRCTV